MIKTQMFIGAALIAGVAAGYFMRGESAAAKPASAAEAPAKVGLRGRIDDVGAKTSVAALRARIAELEKELAKMSATSSATGQSVAVKVPERAEMRPMSFREHMEQMKKNDPERYAQMTNRMATFARDRRNLMQGRLDFLASIDTSGMSAQAAANHQRYQELLVRREELHEDLRNESLTDEERRGLFQKMQEVNREMSEVIADERRNLLGEVAKNLGLEGEDSAALAETVEQVIDATSHFGGVRHRPRPMADASK